MSRLTVISTFNLQNPLFCRLPVISIQGSVIGTYKKDGFGSQWYVRVPRPSLRCALRGGGSRGFLYSPPPFCFVTADSCGLRPDRSSCAGQSGRNH